MSTSNQLKGVYRITSEQDGETYTIDFQPAGRRRMNGTITGTTASVFVHIQPKERPDGLRVEIAGTVLFGRWLDTQHRLLEVISASKTPYAGEWERLADDKKGGWSVPLQWMREHNTSGTRREKSRALTEFATMLRDMAPDHAFDPRTMWDPEGDALRQEQMIAEESKSQKGGKKGKNSGKGKKGGKKNQKSNRAEEIIAKNNAKMEREVVEKDLIQLNSRKKMKGAAGREAIAALTLKTTEGQLAQMQALLDSAMNEMKPPPADQPTRLRVAVDILDTLWETETFLDKMLKKDVAAVEKFMKSNKKLLEKARELRDPIKKLYDYCKLGDEVLIYKKLDLISFQLVHMYDRLPPLSMVHSGKWTLDPWQKRVLTYIDEGRSVVVSAPTSSGKTVLSTYLATKTDVNRSKWSKTSSGKWRSEPTTDKKDKRKLSNIQNGILFVTPTEPLAVQVAAMFSKLKSPTTHLPVFKGVGLAVPSRIFPADRFSEKEVDIVVGTATALETILTSKRTLGFNFNYAVFDEVHNLNGEEGDALERIIRLIDCPFLALSATIKNSDQLQNWFQKAIPTRPVELEVVSSRFINLQRHVWNGQELEMLHPCAALTREQILNEGFDAGDLAFTARDVFSLYKAMKKYYGDKVKHIKPSKCKKSNGEYVFPSSVTVRCRMSHVKQYEEILKKEMVKLAKDMPNETDQLLNGFLKVVTKMDLDHQDTSETKGAGETKDDSVSHLPCHEICVDIKKKDMIPAVIFQMDANKCRKMFVSVVERFEREEDEEFPQLAKTRKKMWEEFQSKYKLWLAEAEQCAKNKEQPPPEPSPPAFDVGDPEPSHTMFQKGRHMNGRELKEILKKMDDLAKKTKGRLRIDASHILIRGLRRGVGIYNEELPGPYLQVVQKFAQKGRLGAVFSDESLAYGVNMPFRTSAFVGDPGPEILDALVAQQAAGRAGRRGMDRQGHLVWVGMTWPRIQGLMRGLLPNICGKNPRYPAIALQAEVSSYSSAPVSDIQLKGVCLHTLHDYVHGRETGNYVEKSRDWMKGLNLSIRTNRVDSAGNSAPMPQWRRELIWNLRSYTSESFALEYLLDDFEELIRRKDVSTKQGDDRYCDQLFVILSAIISRREFEEGQFNDQPLSVYGKELAPNWDIWMSKLKESQDRLKELGDSDTDHEICDQMRLKIPLTSELNSTHFRIFRTNGSYLRELPPVDRYRERLRFFRVGECVRLMYNTIRLSGEHDELNYLMRKTFLRMRYILFESFSEQFAGSSSMVATSVALEQSFDSDLDNEENDEENNLNEGEEDGYVIVEKEDDQKNGETKEEAAIVVVEKEEVEATPPAPEVKKKEVEPVNAAYGKKKKKKKKKKDYVA